MRFTENETPSPASMDFVPRERRSELARIVKAFLFATAAIAILSFTSKALGGHIVSSILVLAIVISLGMYLFIYQQRVIDLMMSTEYQNMLYSQAMVQGWTFFLLARNDGTIVYADRGVRQLFDNRYITDSQALETLFEQGGVAPDDRKRMLDAIHRGTSDRLVFPLTREGHTQSYIMTLEPLARPHGFMIIRGREFQHTRTGDAQKPRSTATEPSSASHGDALGYLFAHNPTAMYITDADGTLKHTNPVLEQLLGYAPGEPVAGELPVQRLFYQIDGVIVPHDYTITDFRGEVLLQRKQGSLLTATLHQTLIRNNAGTLTGAAGSIIPQTEIA